ncbi:protein FAR1-RELATED SEQUENCE [Trifolium repens]|nr:protein FAR1-RELATED SEQUENCE [Trifolium repens]
MNEDWKPKIDIVFPSVESAWTSWVDYSGIVGFGVKKHYSHKKKDGSPSSCAFACSKQGKRMPDKRDYKTKKPRLETRTNCQARLKLKNVDGKFVVYDFVEEHNHSLETPETSHMLSSQRKISDIQRRQIELADKAGVQQRKGNLSFEDVVEEKRYKELMCEFETRQKIPRLKNSYSDILQQMSELYTPTIFDLFQEQYELFEACIVKSMNIQTSSINYVIAMKKDLGEWQVDYDLEKKSICCSCRKFESFGILCCHCLKVFIHMDVTSVPESYILKRWTKIARSGDLQTIGVSGVAEDLDLSPTQRYQKICPRYIRIITEGCRSSEAFMFLNEVADDLDEQMLKFQNMQISNDQLNETSNKVKEVASTNDGSTQVTRLAQKEGRRGSKRWKGWVQSKLAKRKKHSESNASQIKEPVKNKGKQASKNKERRYEMSHTSASQSKKQDTMSNEMSHTSASQIQKQDAVSNTSAPTWLNNEYNQISMENTETSSQFGGATSFTSLLMAQHDDIIDLTDPQL